MDTRISLSNRRGEIKASSENDVLVILLAQNVLWFGIILPVCLLVLCLYAFGFLSSGVSLFLARDLFQSVELLSVELVKFGVDVLDCVFGSWNDDMLAAGCQSACRVWVLGGMGRLTWR